MLSMFVLGKVCALLFLFFAKWVRREFMRIETYGNAHGQTGSPSFSHCCWLQVINLQSYKPLAGVGRISQFLAWHIEAWAYVQRECVYVCVRRGRMVLLEGSGGVV